MTDTTERMMGPYDVVHVTARIRGPFGERDHLTEELERYMYGRSFLLSHDVNGSHIEYLFLVETHYASAIVDRLGSGLFGAHIATAEERYSVGL